MSKIVIIGSGVVGTATGRGFVYHHHDVDFVDIDPGRIDALRSRGLNASDQIDLSGPPAIVFLTLPTPSTGFEFDLTALQKGTEQLAGAIRDSSEYHTVVVRSTVPPGTLEGLVEPTLVDVTGEQPHDGYATASNPEFLRAACAYEDFISPRMTVFGSRSKRTVERLEELYAPFGGEIRSFDDPRYAEFVKCAHNVFNATKISFWNEMWTLGESLDIDTSRVADVVSRSAEGSFNPEYGIRGGAPYGGACLPKDTTGFHGFARDNGVDMPLLGATIKVNDLIDLSVNGEKTVLGHHDRRLIDLTLDQYQDTKQGKLQHALDSRVAIEHAKGMLAERANVDMDEAFTMLRTYARSVQRHLPEVAMNLMEGTATVDEVAANIGEWTSRDRK